MSFKTGFTLCFLLAFCAAQAQYYQTPDSDIPLKQSYNGNFTVSNLEEAFNRGRDEEDKQLNTNLADITFPDSADWAQMNIRKRALWIFNEERKARGLAPFSGLDSRITAIADDFARYLAANDTFGHYADGRSPTDRLQSDPEINGCMDYHWENLFWSASQSDTEFRNFTGFALYNFLYNNTVSEWAHRKEILRLDYNDNSAQPNEEGLLGVGYKKTMNYTRNGTTYQTAAILVLNGIDPCASYNYQQSGIANNNRSQASAIYPNPARHAVHIEHPSKVQAITVYDALGQPVKKWSSGSRTLSVTGLSTGLYQLHIQDGQGAIYRQKLIVQ